MLYKKIAGHRSILIIKGYRSGFTWWIRFKIFYYELILDLLEWFKYRPALKRIEQQAQDLENIRNEIEKLLNEFKLKPENDDSLPPV